MRFIDKEVLDWFTNGTHMKEPLSSPCVALLENTSAVRTSAGGLQIEWHANGWDVEITFDKDGNPVGFYTEKC